MPRTCRTIALVTGLVGTAVLAGSGGAAVAAPAPLRGQATIAVLYDGAGATPEACASGSGAPYETPSALFVDGMVRYAKNGSWHARRGAVVDIQKRASSGAWITIGHANTGWEQQDVENRAGGYLSYRTIHTIMTSPSQRVFRAYLPATSTYQAVVSRTMTAGVFCGSD